MIPNTLKIGSTHQDKNDKMDTVGLYSCEKSYVSVTSPHAIFHDVDINT